MIRRIRWLAALLSSVVTIAGCSSSNPTPVALPLAIVVSAARSSALANGTDAIQIHFEGAAKAPVTLRTERGFFGVSNSITVDATAGDVLLATCDASTSTTCAGDDTVVVTDAAFNTGRVTVQFLGLDQCNTNCGFDVACVAHACTSSSGATGTCSGTTPSACIVGVCSPTQATESTCSEGIDNDCNGKIDCADSACDGQPCKAGASDWACKTGVCTQTTPTAGVIYGIQISPARTRIPAIGANVPVTITVLAGSTPAPGVSLMLATSARSSVFPGVAQTGDDGTVTVQLTGPTTPGTATLTATLAAHPTVSLSASVYAPATSRSSTRWAGASPGTCPRTTTRTRRRTNRASSGASTRATPRPRRRPACTTRATASSR